MKVKSTKLNRKLRGATLLEAARMPRKEDLRGGCLLESHSPKIDKKSSPRQSYADVARSAESPGRFSDESPHSCAVLQKASRQVVPAKAQAEEPRGGGQFDSPGVPTLTYAEIVKKPQSPTGTEVVSSAEQTQPKRDAGARAVCKVPDETETVVADSACQNSQYEEVGMPCLLAAKYTPGPEIARRPSFSKEKKIARVCRADSASSALEEHPVFLNSRSKRNRRTSVSRCSSGNEAKWTARSQKTQASRKLGVASCPGHYRSFIDETAAVIDASLNAGLSCCLLSPRHQLPEDHSTRGLTSRRLPIEERPWLPAPQTLSAGVTFDGSAWTSYLADPSQTLHPTTSLDRLSAGEWRTAVAIAMHLYAHHSPPCQMVIL
ncbi:conserved hypothetical protein [Neospora caninum Liverpool]|uniref:Uncharacterized protein n=1 Tax=Neospora caninum (strain Liverpool) TaxID=572307 RepID=F0V8D6_NEOCL|nr:conserved hypothetical protein [Neospora caninum Liverpool]CBZ49977.1 conserved hypothetical protein [Neospora caninum Liverpool]CEL64565.1 TPA: hypothetical protein BN1204_004540 [Neospora caninum Liverpool]|eukprot:XP_003880012.1 conserved hypothetical protein [Neospora caninum Liverpool]